MEGKHKMIEPMNSARSLPHKKQELEEQSFRRGDFSGVVVLDGCFFCLETVCSPRKVSKASTS